MTGPLVEPHGELSDAELRRYRRHLILPGMGTQGQERLKNAKVLVLGAGGLGSPVLTYLAAAGVGTLGIVDDDVVDESNLHRQVIHSDASIGLLKVDSAAQAIARLNPHVSVNKYPVRLDSRNALSIFSNYDLVIDGTDNFATRYLASDAAIIAGIPEVWGSIFRFTGQAAVFLPEGSGHYRDLFPLPPDPELVPSCAQAGVLGVLCSTIGSIMATEAVKLITGLGEPLISRVMVFEALAMSFSEVKFERDPHRASVSQLLDDYQAWCEPVNQEEPQGEEITASQLHSWLNERDQRDFVLVDIRETEEIEINWVPGAIHIPQAQFLSPAVLNQLRDRNVVLYCRSGVRSLYCLREARAAGLAQIRHLKGGVTSWVQEIEPHQVLY